jgi:hypothetical protein
LFRKLVAEADILEGKLYCYNNEYFTIIREYVTYMFEKRIQSKEISTFFENPNIFESVKEETANKIIIRTEWCALKRNFVDFIEEKVTIDGVHVCDKTMKEIREEIAKFMHIYIFQGKESLVYLNEYNKQELFKVNFPSYASILHDINVQASKNAGNVTYYNNKKKKKQVKKQSFNDDDSDLNNNDDEKESTNEKANEFQQEVL